MFNLDQFYLTLKDYIFENHRHLNPALVYPYPFGSSSPDQVAFESTVDVPDVVFLVYDQEPIFASVPFLDHYGELFKEWGSRVVLITTQRWGVNLAQYIEKYNWTPVYFFFHGIVAQDWYRGYKHNPLIKQKADINYHFYSLNRLFDGPRPHRRWLLCDMVDQDLLKNSLFSFPNQDVYTGRTFEQSCTDYDCQHHNVAQAAEMLPLVLDDNTQQSFYIENKYAKQCFMNIVTETVFDYKENYITEKTLKPFVLGMPFVVLGTPNTLNTLHDYGFETYHGLWNESYDNDVSHASRYQKVLKVIKSVGNLSIDELKDRYNVIQGVLEYNQHHVFSDGLQERLVNELLTNLEIAISKI